MGASGSTSRTARRAVAWDLIEAMPDLHVITARAAFNERGVGDEPTGSGARRRPLAQAFRSIVRLTHPRSGRRRDGSLSFRPSCNVSIRGIGLQ